MVITAGLSGMCHGQSALKGDVYGVTSLLGAPPLALQAK